MARELILPYGEFLSNSAHYSQIMNSFCSLLDNGENVKFTLEFNNSDELREFVKKITDEE